jgi:hypothetical protein
MKNSEKKFTRKTCLICFGLGSIEVSGGNVIDCPGKCENGYIQVEIPSEDLELFESFDQ